MKGPTNPNPDEESEKLLADYERAVTAGETAKSMDIAMGFLVHAAKQAEDRHSPWLDLIGQANAAVRKADWSGAERFYRDAVVAAIAQGGTFPSKAYGDLSWFLSLMDRDTEALAAAKASVENARLFDRYPVTAMAIEIEIAILIKMSRPADALEAAEQALAIMPNTPISALMRSRALVRRARCRIELGQPEAARDDLSAAWPGLVDHADSAFSAGGRGGLATWYEVDAKISESLSDFAKAVESMTHAVDHLRAVHSMPQVTSPYTLNNLARCLGQYAGILRLAGEDKLAAAATLESRQIRENIGLSPL